MPVKVIFHLVKTPSQKLQTITELARDYYHRKENLLFFAPDQKAASFLDELLWKIPETSFIPHALSDAPCKELIVITCKRENFTNAKAVCNLWPTPFLKEKVPTLHELEDLTSPVKKSLSQKRFETYRDAKFIIESH